MVQGTELVQTGHNVWCYNVKPSSFCDTRTGHEAVSKAVLLLMLENKGNQWRRFPQKKMILAGVAFKLMWSNFETVCKDSFKCDVTRAVSNVDRTRCLSLFVALTHFVAKGKQHRKFSPNQIAADVQLFIFPITNTTNKTNGKKTSENWQKHKIIWSWIECNLRFCLTLHYISQNQLPNWSQIRCFMLDVHA